ncbi:hypothetical protein [Clostridium sp. D33t1_170424_F3]|uniref:hypothetical protein n=1 Tax=Clostridium sp. D33t1_170424_F3 TaxID=2787099 RepID=UPI0018A8A6CA|nr:hypothetical protein [Clostridium sp. D33t1_170424_F3]
MYKEKSNILWERPGFYLAALLCLLIGFSAGVITMINYMNDHKDVLTISAEEAREEGLSLIRAEVAKQNPDCPWNETTTISKSIAFRTTYLLYVNTDGVDAGAIFVSERDGKAYGDIYSYDADAANIEEGKRRQGVTLFGLLGIGA